MPPLELVERKLSFDNDPRLASGRGFFYASAAANSRTNRKAL